MNIVIRQKPANEFWHRPYFEAFPEGREDLALYGFSADALYEIIIAEGIDGLESLSEKD